MEFHRPKIKVDRKTIFAAGVVVGSALVVIVLRNQIVWNRKTITLFADLGLLNWIAEEGHVVDFETKVGVFTLTPKK